VTTLAGSRTVVTAACAVVAVGLAACQDPPARVDSPPPDEPIVTLDTPTITNARLFTTVNMRTGTEEDGPPEIPPGDWEWDDEERSWVAEIVEVEFTVEGPDDARGYRFELPSDRTEEVWSRPAPDMLRTAVAMLDAEITADELAGAEIRVTALTDVDPELGEVVPVGVARQVSEPSEPVEITDQRGEPNV
jgi:hypothetical protein